MHRKRGAANANSSSVLQCRAITLTTQYQHVIWPIE